MLLTFSLINQKKKFLLDQLGQRSQVSDTDHLLLFASPCGFVLMLFAVLLLSQPSGTVRTRSQMLREVLV